MRLVRTVSDSLILIEGMTVEHRMGAMRMAVATLLGRDEADIAIDRDHRGKPMLRGTPTAGCSVSHRDDLMLIGAVRNQAVGVDLEPILEQTPMIEIADTLFASSEAVFLRMLPDRQRSLGFYALWCAKEAVLKAYGHGIARGMAWPVLDGMTLIALLAGQDQADVRLDGGIALRLQTLQVGTRRLMTVLATVR